MTRGDGIRDGAVMNPSPGPTASPGNGQKNMASDPPTLTLLNPDWNLRRFPGDLPGRNIKDSLRYPCFLLMQHLDKERAVLVFFFQLCREVFGFAQSDFQSGAPRSAVSGLPGNL